METLLKKLLDDGWQIRLSKCTDRSGPGGKPIEPEHPRVINLILRREDETRIGRAPTLRVAFDEALGS